MAAGNGMAAEAVERLRDMLRESRRGAPSSRGRGSARNPAFPIFAGPGGLWTKYRPIEFREFLASEEARREYWAAQVREP